MQPPIQPIYAPPQGPLEVLHQDAWLLIVSKPAGLLSVPGKGAHLADCLLARVQAAFPGARLVHRLDMDTSGVMVFAQTAEAQRHLGLQFERRHVSKAYLAEVAGSVAAAHGTMDWPLIADWPNRPLQKVCHATGKPSLTGFEVLERRRASTLLRLTPHTGRSHQLRVHCQTLGHPIVGDRFYGGPSAPRLMLHAHTLTLRHPDDGAPVTFTMPPPTALNPQKTAHS